MAEPDVVPAPPRRQPGTSQLLMGLLVIAVGVLFTLDNLGLADAGDYVRYWPVALVGLGLVKLWDARDGHTGALSGFIVTLVGLWLLLGATVDIRISLRDMWSLLLSLFGGYLVWRGVTGPKRMPAGNPQSVVSAIAILSGVDRRSSSQTFRGGDLTAIMGGCEIDLRNAAINGDATIDVLAVWGGIEIRVPEDWTVTVLVTPLLGGVEDKTRSPLGSSAHRLTIRGLVVMAGVEVRH